MGQLSSVKSSPGTGAAGGPPDRATSCRVCVRSLSGNQEVTYRWCSQCNLKVCEDCASYSNIDAKDSIAQVSRIDYFRKLCQLRTLSDDVRFNFLGLH